MFNIFNTLSQVVTTQAAEKAMGLQFTTENIGEALMCAGAGMVGIFLVVGVIILSVSILNKAGSGKKKE